MNRVRTLVRTPLVHVALYDHPAGRSHRDPDEESATAFAVSYVQQGAFQVMRGRRIWRLTPSTLFVTQPGFSYRCAHDQRIPGDVCLAATLAPTIVEEIQTATGRPWRERVPAAPLDNRLAFLRRRLERALADGEGPMPIETLVGEVATVLTGAARPAASLFRDRQLVWYTDRVDEARRLLEERSDERHTLHSLSRQVGMSPFHFARIFRQLTGMPPHRFLLQVRLRRAAGMLRDGAGVTETCLATGFNNLSHFIRIFGRTYGVPPSRYGA